jgi:hypothetical protein
MTRSSHWPATASDAAAGRTTMRPAVTCALPIRAARQNIASYAHLHGAVVTRYGEPVGEISAAALCRLLRAALEGGTDARRARVERLARLVAMSLQGQGGPLCVTKTTINVLRRYARANAARVRREPNGDAGSIDPAG